MSLSTALQRAKLGQHLICRLESTSPYVQSASSLLRTSSPALAAATSSSFQQLSSPQRRSFAVRGKAAWDKRLARRAALPLRRKGKDHGDKRRIFHEWFDPQRTFMEVLDRRARKSGLPFQVRVMAVVERLPVVIPDRENWEKEFEDLQDYLDCFGAVYPEDAPFMPNESEDPGDDHLTDEELFALLPEGFKVMPRITEHDESGNVRTTNRKLSDKLYLTVQDNDNVVVGNEARLKDKWVYPSSVVKDSETMLDAIKRAVKRTIGERVEIWYPSAAPMGVQIRPFKKAQQTSTGFFGEKLFFYKVQYDEGDVADSLKEEGNDSKFVMSPD
jgi:hypothetical protein